MDIASQLVRQVAYELLPLTVHIADEITEHVLRTVPELAPGRSSDEVNLVHESNEQNCGAVLSTVAFGITSSSIEPPAATLSLLSNLAAERGMIAHLLRGYRVGQDRLWRIWSEHAHDLVPPADLYDVLRISSAHLYEFVDGACEAIVQEFQHISEAQPAADGHLLAGSPRELVSTLLKPSPVDVTTFSRTLDYELSTVHIALVANATTQRSTTRRQLQDILTKTGAPYLVVPGHGDSWWAWLSWPTMPTESALNHLTKSPIVDLVIGLGEPAAGHDGFRRSHSQALTSCRIAEMRQSAHSKVVRYKDIEVAALLCTDPVRARAFAANRLGPLALGGDTNERLRATLRSLLDHGHNRAQTAQALHVHNKTVSYRIARAEALLGRSVTESTLDLEIALVIADTLGDI